MSFWEGSAWQEANERARAAHANHRKVVCSCGSIIAQCRCPDPHQIEVRQNACIKCRGETVRVRIADEVADKFGR